MMKTIIKIVITLIALIIFSLMFMPLISYFFSFLSVATKYLWIWGIELLQKIFQMWKGV